MPSTTPASWPCGSPSRLKDLGYRFPEFPLPPGQTPLGYLRELTERGVRARYGEGTLAVRARRQVAHELELIGRLDLAGYFLIVWDIVEHCRTHDILVQGRGSAANSAVCYALGITGGGPGRHGAACSSASSARRAASGPISISISRAASGVKR